MNRQTNPTKGARAHLQGRRWQSCLFRVRRRYDRVAPFYDAAMVVERLFFPGARRRAVELLRLQPGQTVVDIGCGSGRNLPLLREAVGEGGEIIAVDWSPRMLDVARERASRNSWSNVRFLRADAATLTREAMSRWGRCDLVAGADAALSTFALSVIPQWERAYEAMLGLVRPGGQVVIADVGLSARREPGEGMLLRGIWRVALSLTKAAGHRRPWLLLDEWSDVMERFAGGYVGIAGASVPAHQVELAG